jgi:LacI family transcriptional regulator
MTDLEEGSYALTRYLIGLGHRRIVFLVSRWTEAAVSRLRIQGYERAFREEGIRWEADWVLPCSHTDFLNGYAATLKYLKSETPDAIVAINDITALGAKKAVREQGFRIPDDISVAGYDDVIFSSIPEVPLTTVRQDIAGIAAETVKMLIRRIRGEGGKDCIVKKMTPELVIRDSTCGIRRRHVRRRPAVLRLKSERGNLSRRKELRL